MEPKPKDRFLSVESYSHRYSKQHTHSPASLSLTDTDIKAKTASVPSTPITPSYQLRPCEVLLSHYQSCDALGDQLFQRAFKQRADGFFPTSAKIYEDLLRMIPGHFPARLNLGVCYMKMGRMDKAWEVYEMEVRKEGCDARMMYNAAILKAIRGDVDQAAELLSRASTSHPPILSHEIAHLRDALDSGLISGHTIHHSAKTSVIDSPKQEKVLRTYTNMGRKHVKSFSYTSSPTSGFVSPEEKPRPMWGVFKTVRQYTGTSAASSPITPNHTTPLAPRTKASFITTPKFRLRPRRPFPQKSISLRPSTVISQQSREYPSDLSTTEVNMQRNKPLERVRMHGALREEDLEDEQVLRGAQVDEAFEVSVRAKAVEVSSTLRNEAEKLDRLKDLLPSIDIEAVLPLQLTYETARIVQAELRKTQELRDYELILNKVAKLKFFAKFQPDVRRKFLESGHLQVFQPHEVIFSQGETSVYIYVILRGSVVIVKQSPEYGHEPLVLTTLYDGDNFGDLSVFAGEVGKGRSAACKAVELTEVLVIPKEKYREIIVSEIETQLDRKIAFLAALPMFYGAPKTSLIPLASNVSPELFTFNEKLISKGALPRGLYIILSGSCSLYSEGFCLRPKFMKKYARARIRSPDPPPFRVGNTDFHSPKGEKMELQKPETAISEVEIEGNRELKMRLETFFVGEDVDRLVKSHYITQEKLLKLTLKPKDYFGGRVLLEAPLSREGSKYMVQAESAEVRVLVVTRQLLPLIGDKLTEQVRRYLRRQDDYDCPQHISTAQIDAEFRQWTKYRAQLIDQVHKDQSLSRTQPIF